MRNSPSIGSHALDLMIAAPVGRVWEALTTESSDWWPVEFRTSARTRRFVIEPIVGGRAFEDLGDGEVAVWYSVVGLQSGRELVLFGRRLPPFGGRGAAALRIRLTPVVGGTLLEVRDDRSGAPDDESPVEGWRLVFDAGLRRHVESGDRSA